MNIETFFLNFSFSTSKFYRGLSYASTPNANHFQNTLKGWEGWQQSQIQNPILCLFFLPSAELWVNLPVFPPIQNCPEGRRKQMEPCTQSTSNQHSNSVTSNFLCLSSSRKEQHQGDLFHLTSTNIPAHLCSV